MRIGLVANNVGETCVRNVAELPAAFERLGYDSVWFTDHVVGLAAFRPRYRGEWVEALTAMTWAAASTSRIVIGAGVLVAPLRDPVHVAKVVASLDQLSGGRVRLGVGTGWAYREFEALGRAHLFERRGAVTDEALAVYTRCWQGGTFGLHGEFTMAKEIEFAPTPVRGSVPLWIAGTSRPALRRAARWADVWHPVHIGPDELATLGDELDRQAGRTVPRSIRLVVTAEDVDRVLTRLPDYRAARCAHAVLEISAGSTGDLLAVAEHIATELGLGKVAEPWRSSRSPR